MVMRTEMQSLELNLKHNFESMRLDKMKKNKKKPLDSVRSQNFISLLVCFCPEPIYIIAFHYKGSDAGVMH